MTHRIAIIGKDVDTVKSFKPHFVKDFETRSTFVGKSGTVTDFVALVIVAEDADDLELVEESLVAYKNVPIAVFMGEKSASSFTDAPQFGFEAYADVIGFINSRYAELQASIKEVFDSFDEDKSGSIERSELKNAVSKLGLNLNEIDVTNMMKDLDTNKDNQISLAEFSHWWLSGRRGATGTMKKLVSAQIKAEGFIEKANVIVKDMLEKAQLGTAGYRESNLQFSLNKKNLENPGFSFNLGFSLFSQEAQDLHTELKAKTAAHGEPENPLVVVLTLKVKEGAPDFWPLFLKKLEKKMKVIKDVSENTVTLTCSHVDLPQLEMLQMFEAMAAQLGSEAEQSAAYNINLAPSIEEIFAEEGASIASQILKGASLSMYGKIWKDAHKVMLGLAQQIPGEQLGQVAPFMGSMGLMSMTVNGNIDLDIDEGAIGEALQNPAAEAANISALSLFNAMNPHGTSSDLEYINLEDGPYKSNDEFFDAEEEMKDPKEAVEKLLAALAKDEYISNSTAINWHLLSLYLDDEVKIDVSAGNWASANLLFRGKGLGHLLKPLAYGLI